MTRGIFVLLALVSTLGAAPATAVDHPAAAVDNPALAVTELVRVRSGGPAEVTMYVLTATMAEPGLMSFVQLTPRKGGGWARSQFRVLMYGPRDSRVSVYGGGAPAVPVPCPASSDVCGKSGDATAYLWTVRFKPAAGNRYLLAAPPGKMDTYLPPQWRTRQPGINARVVTAGGTGASTVGTVGPGRWVEAFRSATAPGGKYGSGVFAMAPCEGDHSVGSATVKSDGSDPARPITCAPGGYYAAFSATDNGRTWAMNGPVVGETEFPFRLFVIDFPKR